MADQGAIYLIVRNIVNQNPWGQISGGRLASDKSLTGRQVLCLEILKFTLDFTGSLSSEGTDSDVVTSKERSHELSPGYQAGRLMARELVGDGFSPQVFFEAHKEVRTFFLSELTKAGRGKEQDHHCLMIIESFIGDLATGFALEKIRAVRTVSRRRQQEAKRYILQEKKRYGAIFYQMEEPAFVVGRDLRLTDVNPACEKFFGIESDKLIGSKCCDVIGEGFCGECPLKDILDNGKSFSNFEITLPSQIDPGAKEEVRQGIRTLLLAGASLGEEAGAPDNGGIVIIQDITERKNIELELDEYRHWLEDFVDERTEELLDTNERLQDEIRERRKVERELIQASADLKRSNADLEQFAQVASHDLREPLMLVASFAERLVKGYAANLDERGMDYLQRIIKATGKLQELVDSLFQLSKVSTSSSRFETLDMNELVRDVVGDLGEMVKQAGAQVEIDQLDDLKGDAIQMRQLFQNVISNALKYTRADASPSVRISSRTVGDFCEITIEDNGIGLNEEDLERIFEPFVRLHDCDAYDGSGMGLTTCHKIVSRHGGKIFALSKPGNGAVFIIRLPLSH